MPSVFELSKPYSSYESSEQLKLLNTLIDIEKLCFEKKIAWGLCFFDAVLRSNNVKLLLIKENEKIIGYLVFTRKLSGSSLHVHISSIAIHPLYQRGGKGREAIKYMLRDENLQPLKNNQNVRVSLECRPEVEQFYRSLGFEATKIESDYYDFYQKRLNKTIKRRTLDALQMSASRSHILNQVEQIKQKPKAVPISKPKQTLKILIEFCQEIQNSLSFWPTFFYRDYSKNNAFTCIIKQLRVLKNIDQIDQLHERDFEEMLRCILGQAFRPRGYSVNQIIDKEKHNTVPETKSGKRAIELLNTEKFSELSKYMNVESSKLKYHEIRRNFVGSLIEKNQDHQHVFRLRYLRQDYQQVAHSF